MKLLIWLVLLGVLMATYLQAADVGSFAEGNARYAAGDYVGAAKAYEEQVANGKFSANLFYNSGDAYHRLGDRGHAILNYRRALILEPTHAEASANLAFIGGTKGAAGQGRAAGWWEALPWTAAVCGWLGVTGLLTALASRRWRVIGTGVAVSGFVLCAVGIALSWYLDDGADLANRAVVVKDAASALYSPVDSAKVVTTLPAGGEVRVLSEQGAWLYVSLSDGTTRAWMAAKEVERLVPR